MLSRIKNTLRRHLKNVSGWRTDRKIVVIESDDWGSIRMPSKEVYEKCLKNNYRVDQFTYEQFDSLASERDLEFLFEILNRYKGKNGRPAIMTANVVAANPDFEKIKASGYKKYFYELITETFKKYPEHSNCFDLWETGKENKLFFPQSHGREHLNVSMFMKDLQGGKEDVLFALEHQMPGCITKGNPAKGNKYMKAMRYSCPKDKKEKLDIIIEGLRLFKELFGFHSESFIPPSYMWSPDYNESIARAGVRFLQGRRRMMEPLYNGDIKFNTHKLGEENSFGQRYLIRNAFFEPSLMNSKDGAVEKCLKDINTAFYMKKPAIICSHRINYVGFIDHKNRDQNLKLLKKLLDDVVNRWPEVEFMNSVELAKLMDQ